MLCVHHLQVTEVMLSTNFLAGGGVLDDSLCCDRQFDGREQSKDCGPGTEGHQSGKPRVPSNGQ